MDMAVLTAAYPQPQRAVSAGPAPQNVAHASLELRRNEFSNCRTEVVHHIEDMQLISCSPRNKSVSMVTLADRNVARSGERIQVLRCLTDHISVALELTFDRP